MSSEGIGVIIAGALVAYLLYRIFRLRNLLAEHHEKAKALELKQKS